MKTSDLKKWTYRLEARPLRKIQQIGQELRLPLRRVCLLIRLWFIT